MEQPKVLINDIYPNGDSMALLPYIQRKVAHDLWQGTKIPLTFHINTKPVNEDKLPMNEVLSDKPFPNDKLNTNKNNEKLSDSPDEKTRQGKLESNVILSEGKLNPLSIGIRLDEDKNKESAPGAESNQISLQDVLKDIDDTSRKYNSSGKDGNPQKDNSVFIDLNDLIESDKPRIQPSNGKDDKSGKVQLEATSHKDNVNGTEVETAGVSITTESKGFQTGGLIKVLLSKLLGSKLSEELKGKVEEELTQASGRKNPDDLDKIQKIGSRPHSLDEASTAATGTLVESSPGTVQGVDVAEPNKLGGEQPSAPYPIPLAVEASTAAAGTLVESSPGTVQGVDVVEPNNQGGGEQPPAPSPVPLPVPCPNPSQIPAPAPPPISPPLHPPLPVCIPVSVPPGPPRPVMTPQPVPGQPPYQVIYGSTKAAGQGVESPPGTIMAVGTNTNEMQQGDRHGKLN